MGWVQSTLGDDRIRVMLGDVYDLTSFSIWNNGGGIDMDNEGVQNYSLTFYDSGLNNVGSYSGTVADLQTEQTQAISATNVSFVDFTAVSGHNVNYTIFTEIQFTGNVVPEPSALALLGIGVGLASFRRRRNQ